MFNKLIFSKIQKIIDFFSKKKQKTHCQLEKSFYFCTPFPRERDGEKKPTVLLHHAGITQLVE